MPYPFRQAATVSLIAALSCVIQMWYGPENCDFIDGTVLLG